MHLTFETIARELGEWFPLRHLLAGETFVALDSKKEALCTLKRERYVDKVKGMCYKLPSRILNTLLQLMSLRACRIHNPLTISQ